MNCWMNKMQKTKEWKTRSSTSHFIYLIDVTDGRGAEIRVFIVAAHSDAPLGKKIISAASSVPGQSPPDDDNDWPDPEKPITAFTRQTNLRDLRSAHTRGHVAGTCRGDFVPATNPIVWTLDFHEKSCCGDEILSPRHVPWIQISLNSGDMSRRQNNVTPRLNPRSPRTEPL